MSAAPAELAALHERAAILADLGHVHSLLFWDQNTMMPPHGAGARGDHSATLESVTHERLTDPELGRLLDVLEPWAAGEDPDADDVRLVRELRRDFEKAVRVPTSLAAELSRAAAHGQAAWQEARAAADFSRFRDALERQIELRHRYVDCFTGFEHRYDALLDDFEPGMTTAALRPLFAELSDGLVPLLAGVSGNPPRPEGGPFGGPHEVEHQRRALMAILEGDRLRSRRLAPGRRAAPVRAADRARRRPHHHALRPARLRQRLLRLAARVRARALRGRHPGPARAQPARLAGLARRARVAEPAVGEPRRPQPPVLRLGAPAPRREPARAPAGHDRGRRLPRRQRGPPAA